MSEERKDYETWKEVICNFLKEKAESKEANDLKKVIEDLKEKYKKVNYFNNPEIKSVFEKKKDKEQSSIEFYRKKFRAICELTQYPEGIDFNKVIEERREHSLKFAQEYEPQTWITYASHNASGVSFATHVSKLTHPSANGTSFCDQVRSKQEGMLTTSTLKNPEMDGAVKGNQYAPIYQFLELELKGSKLRLEFAENRYDALKAFAENCDELHKWISGFKKVFEGDKTSSDYLMKQVYFPIRNDDFMEPSSYHLLCNIISSSLAQVIYESIPRTKKGNDKFVNKDQAFLPNRAAIKVTASNHGNASQLNGKRGGKLELLCSSPPIWEKQIKPPIHQRSFFYVINTDRINKECEFLRKFLCRFDRLKLSIKDPKRNKWVEKWVENILEEVFWYVIKIQNLPFGWSKVENAKLKIEHQYLLDPYRSDEAFQKARSMVDWQSVICNDFANWLNGKMRRKGEAFTPQKEHTRLWKSIIKNELREFTEITDLNIKSLNKE